MHASLLFAFDFSKKFIKILKIFFFVFCYKNKMKKWKKKCTSWIVFHKVKENKFWCVARLSQQS